MQITEMWFWTTILTLGFFWKAKALKTRNTATKKKRFFGRERMKTFKIYEMPIIKFYIPIGEYFAKTRVVVTKIYKHVKTLIFLEIYF